MYSPKYLQFKVIVILTLKFVLRVSSDSDFRGSEGGEVALCCLWVNFAEAGGDDGSADVDGGVVPIDEPFLGVEVDEEEGVMLRCLCCQFNGGLLVLRRALGPISPLGSLVCPVGSVVGVVKVINLRVWGAEQSQEGQESGNEHL